MFKIFIGFSVVPFVLSPFIVREVISTEQKVDIEFVKPYDEYERQQINSIKRITSTQPPRQPTVEELYPLDSLPADWKCTEYFHLSLNAGWTIVDWPRLGNIMYRESRCIPTACGKTDSPNIRKCRDWGLLQINDYSWKTTVRGLGLDIEQMWEPYWNLWFGRWLFNYSLDKNGDGWQPWRLQPQSRP